MADIEFYNVGDYVMVNNQNTLRTDIGRIMEIMEQYNNFSYILFYKPEETHCGRLAYHGKNEIFKTTINQEESMNNIASKIEVKNLADYARLPTEEKFVTNRFICRQNYDPNEQKFSPELEPDCFCQRIINPDDELVVCECDRVYHNQCITNESATCPTCDASLLSQSETIYKKRKQEDDKSILLKSNKEQEFYDLFASALDDVATDVQESTEDERLPTNKSLNEKRPMPHLDIKRKPSTGNPLTPRTGPVAKKGYRKELGNVDNEAFQRIKLAIENFSKAHQNRNMSDVEKARYFIKEKYYKSLLYGIEEVYEKQKVLGSHLHLNEEERGIALRDTRENYKKAQDIALSVEAIIWHTLNKNKMRLEANYSMKNRELLNYLMDDGNYELRLSVLIGEKKPEFLCKASGKDLLSKEMSEKIQERENKMLKLSKLPDDVRIVAKSHKGEVVIEAEPEVPKAAEPVKEPEPIEEEDDTAVLNEIVTRIERGSSEHISGRDRAESYNPLSLDEDKDFGEFKLGRKQSSQKKNGEDMSPENRQDRPVSVAKSYEDILMQTSNIASNKLIDQEVLKTVVNFFFDKTYSNVSERLTNHLKPEIANEILREINKKHKNE